MASVIKTEPKAKHHSQFHDPEALGMFHCLDCKMHFGSLGFAHVAFEEAKWVLWNSRRYGENERKGGGGFSLFIYLFILRHWARQGVVFWFGKNQLYIPTT